MSDKIKHIFSSDRPIQNSSEDLLNRSKFSKELSTSISNWREKDSLVIAIYGAWGDGKSSVKNMLLEQLNAKSSQESILLEFNPWQWSKEDGVTEAFFNEIAAILGRSKDKNQKEIAKKIKEYAEYLELSNELFLKIKSAGEKVLILSAGGSGILSGFVDEKYRLWIIIFSFFLFLISQCFEVLIWGFKWLNRWLNLGTSVTRTLEERKADLTKSLRMLYKTLVIIIDDIDRLSGAEIKNLFRVIKANADFPNIVYVTLFQRDIVEKSLREEGIYEGDDYLKKIVQVGFNLPKVPDSEIHKILFKKLDELLEESGLDKKFDQSRWNELFLEGVNHYFKNLRDVNRFISTFSFHLGILKQNSSYEINFIDLLGMEVLRQFEPIAHERIFFLKNLMTASAPSGSRNYSEKRDKQKIEDLLSHQGIKDKTALQAIIKVLFPNVQWTWSNYFSSVDQDDFIKLRINHPERFDRYFSLFLSTEEIPQSDFEYALSITGDEVQFFNFLMKYYDENKLPLFISKFEAYKQEVRKEDAIPFISTILRIGDYLSDEHDGFFSISPLMNARRIIHWYFKKRDFEDDKIATYEEAIKKSQGIFLPISLLSDEYERRQDDKYPDSYVFNSEQKEHVKNLLKEKIEQCTNSELFRNNIHLPQIIHIWKTDIDKNEALAWLNNYLQNDDNFIAFLMRMESKGFSSSGYSTTVTYRISCDWLKVFFHDLGALFERVKRLEAQYSNSDEEKIKRLFDTLRNSEEQFLHPEKNNDRF